MGSQAPDGGATLQLGILGPLRIEVGGDEVALPSARQRAIVAMLLVEPGAAVSTGRLAEVLWGDGQPDDPAGAVRTHVSRLRGLLRTWCGESTDLALVTHPHGYALAIDPAQVDAGRFERLVGAARAATSPEVVVERTGRALALWRADPLPELDHPDATAAAARLERLRDEALELRADAMLRLGRFSEVVADLAPVVARHPLREAFRGQLMVALHRSGRQADALAEYRALRDALVAALGMEPSPPLRRLELAILQQDDELPWPAPPLRTAPVAVEGGPAAGIGAATGAGPEERTSFVGRDAELQALAAALGERRTVVLTGVGGVGKSRLARRVTHAVADRYADGVVVCDLVSAEDDGAVAELVATALGGLPAPGGRPERWLVELLGAQQLLLVLDNCEHVVAGASALVEDIAARCPGVDVLATSRRPLRASAQQLWPVPPLEVAGAHSAAVQLFRDRAASADPTSERGDGDRDAVVELCRRLDGLPLAIELAAAQVRFSNPADIVDRLDRRPDALAGGPQATSPRHRSLHAVLDWSAALLPEASRVLLDRLAVFAGSFTHEAAAAVCADEVVPGAEVVDRLADLVDQSLVVVDRTERHARYRLLETVRAYGEAHLRAGGELDGWRHRHAEHVASLAEAAAVGLRGPDEARWVAAVDAELANLRAAQRWACATGAVGVALRSASALGAYAYQRLHDEVHGWAIRAVELPAGALHPAYPGALVTAAAGRVQRGDLVRARVDGERAIELATDEEVVLRAGQLLAEVSLYQGHLEEADRRGQALVERSRLAGDAYHEALGQLYRVHAAAYRGRPGDARGHLTAGWEAVAVAGTPTLQAGYRYLEGEIRIDDDPAAARTALAAAIETARPVRNRFVGGVARVALASLEARHGEPDAALVAFREIVDHWRRSGDRVHLWTTIHNLLVLLERIGAAEPAAVLHGAVQTATTGARAFGADAERVGAAAAALRSALGHGALAAAEATGRGMGDDQVIAFALDAIDRCLAERTSAPPPQ